MIIFVGALIVIGSVLGGFLMAGGHIGSLMHLSELIIIAGSALGALVIMSPKKILIDLVKGLIHALKGTPYKRNSYDDLFKALYELFLVGRRNGMIALEEHVINPETSAIFKKYPSVLKNKEAIEFLCGGLRPIIDGKIKPEQLHGLMELELERMEDEHHAPISVLTKAADAMPGFGIVAAVLGIVITMGAISGPIEEIGHKVGAALVGTFLGIFISYGFMNPLAVNMEFIGAAETKYSRCIATCVIAFANGMAPLMACEMGRRSLSNELRCSADDMEVMLKAAVSGSK
ncbi:MAG TPA: flagellar motor stator protein MotA [Candidatus Limnocylindria bacterium]|nr:flagellar motor stator protein MotA [Candidatus Limnocylindria bacterium]